MDRPEFELLRAIAAAVCAREGVEFRNVMIVLAAELELLVLAYWKRRRK